MTHLFFACGVSNQIWKKVLAWQGLNRDPMCWEAEVSRAESHAKGKSPRAQMYRMAMAAAVYYIWLERNQRIFQETKKSANHIIKQIVRS